jgi:adenosine kinase
MNLEEAHASWFKKEYETSEYMTSIGPDRKELKKFATHCLNKGVKCVYITTDATGCLVYFKEKGKVIEELVPVIKVKEVVDTTGCGDSFAGGVGYGLLQDPKNYIKAGKYGNVLGALRTQGKTFDVFKSLDDVNQIMKQSHV